MEYLFRTFANMYIFNTHSNMHTSLTGFMMHQKCLKLHRRMISLICIGSCLLFPLNITIFNHDRQRQYKTPSHLQLKHNRYLKTTVRYISIYLLYCNQNQHPNKNQTKNQAKDLDPTGSSLFGSCDEIYTDSRRSKGALVQITVKKLILKLDT